MRSTNRLVQRAAAFALPAALLLGGMLCGPSGPFLYPEVSRDPLYECQQFECPIARGSNLRILTGFFDTDISVAADPSRVTYMPTGIVETVSIEEGVLTVHGRHQGSTELTAIIDGKTITQTISVAPLASTKIEIDDHFVPSSLADESLAIVTNATLRLFARHQSADGEQIVAESMESWSMEQPTASTLDLRGLWTLETGPVEESLQISAGLGEPLLLDVVLPSAVAKVSLMGQSKLADGWAPESISEGETIVLSVEQYSKGLGVAPLTSEGTMVLGLAVEVLELSGEVAFVQSFEPGDTFLSIRPTALGVGALRLRVGEREITYPIRVEEGERP